MQITATHYTIADYCAALNIKDITVNREYQRSDKVWPPAAKSFLIESIILGYPIPKLLLAQKTDIKSRKTVKEIVDGQQRSQAILEFFNDELRLARTIDLNEIAGRSYSELEDDYKQRFLDYALSIDLFVSATSEEIRETFRRINSYTVPLNPEEQRHALYQGVFKWFAYGLSRKFDQNLLDIGVFKQKDLVRMADAKLMSEVTHAMLHGIKTTKKPDLDKLYDELDIQFPLQDEISQRISTAVDFVVPLTDLHNGPLTKPHMFYSLLLAIAHVQNPVEQLMSVYEPATPYRLERDIVISNLTGLAEAAERGVDGAGKFQEFVSASATRTNVAEQRKTRVVWFCRALQPALL